jgi:hypothetical protein
MVATFHWCVQYGASPGSEELNATNTNFKALDDYATVYSDSTARITIPSSGTNYSFERWIRGKFTDSFNTIENVLFWKSSGTIPAGIAIFAGVQDAYATPVNTVSGKATAAIPITSSTALSPHFVTPYTDYICMQLQVASTAAPGNVGPIEFTCQYDES